MKSSPEKGILYLLPTPLSEGVISPIPEANLQIVSRCRHFVVETPKTGRRHIRSMDPDKVLQDCEWLPLSKKSRPEDLNTLLTPALNGQDMCLLSDAGSPTIADPGAPLVAMAHRRNIKVVPLSGPSSIMLALMGSGFHGQPFTFHGYLSPKRGELKNDLKRLEKLIEHHGTQVFMETPYRNQQLVKTALEVLQAHTLLCIACDLTDVHEFIRTRTVQEWSREAPPDLHKKPCIFLLGIV